MKKHIIIFFLFPLWGLGGYSQTVQWVKRGGSVENIYADNEGVFSIATDSEKNYYVLSRVAMSGLNVDGNSKTNYDNPSSTPNDIVLASFACDGTYRWSKVFGGGEMKLLIL